MTQASLRYFNCSRKTVIKSFLLQELQYAAAIVSFNIHCRVNHPHSLQSSLMPKFKITSDWIISSIKSETCSLHVKILYLQIPPSQNPQVWWSWESTGLINPELRTLNPKDVLEEPQRSLKSFPPLVGFHSPIRLFSQWLLNSCWQIYKSSNSPETETFFLEPGQRDDIKPFVKRVSGERLPPLWINEPSRKKNKKKHTHREKKKENKIPPGSWASSQYQIGLNVSQISLRLPIDVANFLELSSCRDQRQLVRIIRSNSMGGSLGETAPCGLPWKIS